MRFEKEAEIIGGLFGDGLDAIGKSITDGIVNGFLGILKYIIVIIYWGCKIGIIVCLLTYICSQDRSSISLGVKLGFIYLITAIIGGMV